MTQDNNSRLQESYKDIAKGGATLFIGFFVIRVLGYVFRVILARFLGKDDYGLITLSVSALEIITLFSVLGLPNAIPRFIGYYSGLKNYAKIKGTLISVLKLTIPISIIVSILLFHFSELIAKSIFKKPELTVILQVFSFVVPFANMKSIFMATHNGFKNVIYYLSTNISLFVFLPLNFLILYAFGLTLKAAYFSYAASYILSFSLALVFTIKLYKRNDLAQVKSQSIIKELFSYSWPLIFHRVVWYLMIHIDTLMIGYYKTNASVGTYNVCTPLAYFIGLFLYSFGLLFLPIISEYYSRNDFDGVNKLYSLTLKWITIFTVPLFMFLNFCHQENIQVFFGAQYFNASPTLRLITIGFFFDAILGLQSWILSAAGRTKLLFINSSVGLLINFILNYLLIPRFDINGAAIATSSTLILINLLGVIQINIFYKIKTFRFKSFLIIAAGVISILVTKFLLSQFMNLYTILGLLTCFAVFMIIYGMSLLVIGISSDEDKILFSIIQNKTGLNLNFLSKLVSKLNKPY